MSLNRRLPGLVNAPTDATAQQSQWMEQVTTALRSGLGQSKSQDDKWLTWKDLESSQVVVKSTRPGGGFLPSNPPTDPPDMTPPPGLENVEASGGMTAIYIKWSDPNLSYFYHIEVHRSATDDVGTAVLVGTTMGNIYNDLMGSDTNTYFYWVRIVKESGGQNIIGPWHDTKGVQAKAAEDPDWILDQISGKFDSDDLKTQVFTSDLFGVRGFDDDGNPAERFSFAVDNTVSPPIVAIDGASIVTASIKDAAILNLTVDKLIGHKADWVEANIRDASITNAKIGNIIRSNNYHADESGWVINKNGFAEFNDVVVRGTGVFRGTIYAEEIIGDLVSASVSKGNNSLNTGWSDFNSTPLIVVNNTGDAASVVIGGGYASVQLNYPSGGGGASAVLRWRLLRDGQQVGDYTEASSQTIPNSIRPVTLSLPCPMFVDHLEPHPTRKYEYKIQSFLSTNSWNGGSITNRRRGGTVIGQIFRDGGAWQ